MRCLRLALVVAVLGPAVVSQAGPFHKPLQMPRQNLRPAPVETAPLRMRPVEEPYRMPFREAPAPAPLRQENLNQDNLRSEPFKSPVQTPANCGGPYQKPAKSCVQKR